MSVESGKYERGHVFGAVNFNWHTDLVRRDLISEEDFEELHSKKRHQRKYHGSTLWRQQQLVCSASHPGYETSNYDGSPTEYGNSVGVPIENPADTVWTGQ